MNMQNKKIVVIGGGTGTYTVLSGLKKYPVDLTAIISMTDSGGSNRVLRDEFGLLPTSDIRQCLVALASENSDKRLRQLFTYRYHMGTGITGMTFGNLFMAALTDIYGSQEKAIEETSRMLGVVGKILPVTFDDVHLVARYDNGKQVLGEHYIDDPDSETGRHRIVELEVIPQAKANPKAVRAIRLADLIVMGPGDLFTSLICNLIVDGVSSAIRRSKAKKLYIMNLMTKFGETNGFSAKDHIEEIEKYLGSEVINYCLVSTKHRFPKGVLTRYRQEKAYPVVDDLKGDKLKVMRRNLMANEVYTKAKGDLIKRSLIRHDPKKIARAIVSLL